MVDAARAKFDAETKEYAPIDIDLLRGWREHRDPELREDPVIPALARLEPTGDTSGSGFPFHGPELYIGRFHPQHGPVDLIFSGLQDHEVYRLSAPHVRVSMDNGGRWRLRSLSPAAVTKVQGETLEDTRTERTLEDGHTITLGVAEFIFRVTDLTYEGWLEARKALLTSVNGPSLFLKRFGVVCGPHMHLDPEKSCVVGRSFPQSGPHPVGTQFDQPDWDLAGLWDHEKKFVAFRHVRLSADGDQWTIEPLGRRQRTYVNRIEISGKTPLMPGDEVGLGSVLLHFHHPSDFNASTSRRTAELPTVVNWKEEHTRKDLPQALEEPTDANSRGDEAGVEEAGVEEASEEKAGQNTDSPKPEETRES